MKFLTLIVPFVLLIQTVFAGPFAETASDKGQYHLFHPTPQDQMRDFAPDRPSQTDGPFTIDAGHFELEMDFLNATLDHHSPDGVRYETWNAAPLNIRVGLLNSVEFDVVLDNYVLSRSKESDAPNFDHTSGFGDITARFKINFWGNDGGTTALGLIPFVKLPLSASNLRNGKVEGGVVLPLDVKLPNGWDLGMMTEWDFVTDGGGGYDSEFVNSLTLGHGIVGKLSGYVEFFSVVGTAPGFRWIGQVDAGLTYGITANTQIDFGCNFGVTKSAPDYNPFVGFSVRF